MATPFDEYGPILLDHFDNPRNVGEIDSPDAAATVRSSVHGDTIRLTMRIHDGRLDEVRFKAFGCPVTIAAASIATEMLAGRTVGEALALENEEIAGALGGLPDDRVRCSVLVEEAVRSALGGSGGPGSTGHS